MRTAVFYSAGIGDALLLTPLVRKLTDDGHEVWAVITGKDAAVVPLEQFGLCSKVIRLKSKSSMTKAALRYRHNFDLVFLNVFACTGRNILLASAIGRKVVCHKTRKRLPVAVRKSISIVRPVPNIHESLQNLRLYDTEASQPPIKSMHLDVDGVDKRPLKGPYVTLQPCTGNNRLSYKNWPLGRWREFVRLLTDRHPQLGIVLLGDRNETAGSAILESGTPSIINRVGKTTLHEAITFLKHSHVFIGLDGGLMHLCAAIGTPTFTLWGISDHTMYGYQDLSEDHHIVTAGNKALYSWLDTRDYDLERNDYLNTLEVSKVFSQFTDWYRKYE